MSMPVRESTHTFPESGVSIRFGSPVNTQQYDITSFRVGFDLFVEMRDFTGRVIDDVGTADMCLGRKFDCFETVGRDAFSEILLNRYFPSSARENTSAISVFNSDGLVATLSLRASIMSGSNIRTSASGSG